MTNTRITDAEVLERRFPVRLRSFRVRRGSGGAGVWRGGDGVVRAVEFLAPMQAALLSERRGVGPFGLGGAAPGARGRNLLRRRAGPGPARERGLPGKVRLDVQRGDVLVIETPGGGGYTPSAREWAAMDPAQARRLFREGRWRGPTSGIAMDRVQANLVAIPAGQADAFEAYCRATPAPCPLLERLAAGDPRPRALAAGADLRCDLPGYRVLRREGDALTDEAHDDVTAAWRDDLVAFLLGCSFAAERPLAVRGIPLRHVEEGLTVPMFRTRRRTRAVGPFAANLVVSMRPVPRALVKAATEATRPYVHAHGAPVHVGDAEAIGVDLTHPDWGDPVPVRPGEVPVFWACGVTSQLAVRSALEVGAIDLAIAHAPGRMFVGDVRSADLLEASG